MKQKKAKYHHLSNGSAEKGIQEALGEFGTAERHRGVSDSTKEPSEDAAAESMMTMDLRRGSPVGLLWGGGGDRVHSLKQLPVGL